MLREFVMRDGVCLRGDLLCGPRGAPVLLLHGGGQTRHAWRGTAASLNEQGWSTVAVDLRGHGHSDWSPDGEYGLETFVADVSDLTEALDAPPVLVGASLGGLSSMLAVAGGARATALVLVDVAHRFEMAGAQRIVEFMRQRPAGFDSPDQAAEQVAAYLPHRAPPPDATGLLKNLRHRDGRWHWHWDPALLGVERRFTAIAERLSEAVTEIDLPVLLVRGAISDVVSPEIAAEFAALAPRAEVVEVPAAAHMVAGDSNDRFTDAVTGFLERVGDG
jgi:pimeloyl-ACP methyl ester carboxylesterase